MVPKSSYKLIAITGKSAFETLELASDFAEPLSHSAPKIRFCKAHCKGHLSSLKMVPKSCHKLIAITGKSMLERGPPAGGGGGGGAGPHSALRIALAKLAEAPSLPPTLTLPRKGGGDQTCFASTLYRS
jgi:hypothetical protein